jgi:hypothetical protein
VPDIKLKSMKVDAKNREETTAKPVDVDRPIYPWGLAVNLDNDSLEKLGINRLPPVGKSLMLVARVDVTSVSEHESKTEGGQTSAHRNVALQITDMGLGANEADPQKAQDVLYKK